MTGDASVWEPRTAISGNTQSAYQYWVLTGTVAVFNITKFSYAVGTGALAVYKNGLLLVPELEWVEVTDSSFQLITPAIATDVVHAVGHVGISAVVNTYPEIGVWTPELWDYSYSGTEGQTYVLQEGLWWRFESICHIYMRMELLGKGTLTAGDRAFIGGLPFAASNRQTDAFTEQNGQMIFHSNGNLPAPGDFLIGTIGKGLQYITLGIYDASASNVGAALISYFNNNTAIGYSQMYEVQ